MGQDPSQIRQDIEQTRGRMGDTVEALGHKTDVTGRAKGAISDRVEGVKSKVTGATPDGGQVKQGARQAVGIAQENPFGLAIGAAAVGFIGGLLIPGTRMEDERIGPMADQMKEKARETGQEAMERGKEGRAPDGRERQGDGPECGPRAGRGAARDRVAGVDRPFPSRPCG